MKIADLIRKRRTEKVMCEPRAHQKVPAKIEERNKQIILEAILTAGWAPFHHRRQENDIAEPWRAHILWSDEVGKLARYLKDEMKVSSKEPNLAAACNALILITWIPQFYHLDVRKEAQINIDEEHLAAASAMVQNLLLLMTENQMGTYWGSGGILRKPVMFQYLGIPENERLLAAIHVEYPDMKDNSKERKPGKNREVRTEAWIREVSL